MKKILFLCALLALPLMTVLDAKAEIPVVFGELYYEDMVVRTVIPPAASPKEGRDNLYVVPNQLAVIGVAPGDTDYHGGKWAVHMVEWNEAPYDLTSEADVLSALMAGDISVTRVPSMDFKCPVQL